MCSLVLQMTRLQNLGFLWLLEVVDIGCVGGVAVYVAVAVAVVVAVVVVVVLSVSTREARTKNVASADLVILYLMSRFATVSLRYSSATVERHRN